MFEVVYGFGVLYCYLFVVVVLVLDCVEGWLFMVLWIYLLGVGDFGILVIGGEFVFVVLVLDWFVVLVFECVRVVEVVDVVEVVEVVIEVVVFLY